MNRGFAIVAGLLISLPSFAITDVAAPQAASPSDPFAAYDMQLKQAASVALDFASRRDPEPPIETRRTTVRASAPQPVRTAAFQRVENLRPLLEPILRNAGVPPKLAAVVLVESGGQPAAVSPKGALGLWQLMPETARRYGLLVNVNRDERLDVIKSSHAAANYLHDLYVRFGDWALALAAYNAGENAVQRGLDRARENDFFRLSHLKLLPEETRKYVPSVLASMNLFDGPVDATDASVKTGTTGAVRYALSRPGN